MVSQPASIAMVSPSLTPRKHGHEDMDTGDLPDTLGSIKDLADMNTASDTMSQLGLTPMEKAECQSPLLNFLRALQETVEFHCQISKEIIRQEEGTELLHEYHKRWTAFVAFAVKMDEVLAPLSHTVNVVYEKLFPGFPVNPAFSFWRFMLRIWKRQVFSPVHMDLQKEILKVISQFEADSI